jgi:hypothetical protein
VIDHTRPDGLVSAGLTSAALVQEKEAMACKNCGGPSFIDDVSACARDSKFFAAIVGAVKAAQAERVRK